MFGLPASHSSAASPPPQRPPVREAVAGMGYRLAAGGLAGRLRAGDGGVGPCIEDAWVRQVARLWMDVTRAARGADLPRAAAPVVGAARAFAAVRDAASRRARALPLLALCQASAALVLTMIGSSTFIYWQKSHASGMSPGLDQMVVASAAVPRAVAREADSVMPVPPLAVSQEAAPDVALEKSPPAEDAQDGATDPQPLPATALAAPPAVRHAPPPVRIVRPQMAMTVLQPPAAALRVAPAPHVFAVLASRPVSRPHHAPRAAQAQVEMPHWLTAPRGPLIMSAPPHDLALPPLLALPRADRFAAGSYVPPMMPGAYVYR